MKKVKGIKINLDFIFINFPVHLTGLFATSDNYILKLKGGIVILVHLWRLLFLHLTLKYNLPKINFLLKIINITFTHILTIFYHSYLSK